MQSQFRNSYYKDKMVIFMMGILISGKMDLILKVEQAADWNTWLILGFRPANVRRSYKVTPSLIGWVQT